MTVFEFFLKHDINSVKRLFKEEAMCLNFLLFLNFLFKQKQSRRIFNNKKGTNRCVDGIENAKYSTMFYSYC